MYQKSNERAQRVSEISDTSSIATRAKIPYTRPANEVIYFYLFHLYWVNISSLYLEKMTKKFEKQGPAQITCPECPKNTSFVGLYPMLWVKILTKKVIKNKKKWPLKHRIVLSIEKSFDKTCHWHGTVGGLSSSILIGWVESSLDAFVAPCYSRNRAFRGFWWLIQRIYCNIRVPPVKNGFIKCPWGRNNWTSREWGFRSCHFLRSFSSVRRVWWCQIVAQNQRHIHIHRH